MVEWRGLLKKLPLMNLVLIHNGLSNTCTIFSLIICGYGLIAFFRDRGVDSTYLGILVIGELLYIAQLLVGVGLLLENYSAARTWVHYLYGVVLIISLPGLYAYVRGRDTRREALMYALMGLFLAGISLRGVTTGAFSLPF